MQVHSVLISITVLATLGCQPNWIWTQQKDKAQRTLVKDFLDQVTGEKTESKHRLPPEDKKKEVKKF